MNFSNKLFITIALSSAMLSSGCDNNDDSGHKPSNNVLSGFNAKYPEANQVEWKEEGAYHNVEFKLGGIEYDAWFDNNGAWVATNIDLPFHAFGQAVQNGFKNSAYGTWQIDDTEVFERVNQITIYIIEAKNGPNKEVILYFNAQGTLLKEGQGGTIEGGNPANIPSDVQTFLNSHYPQSVIIDTERNTSGSLEVDIIHNNIVKEVLFTTTNQWIQTSWDISRAQTPQVVLDVLSGTAYVGFTIDSIDFHQTPTETEGFYHIDLKKQGSLDTFVNIKPNGEILLN